MSATNLQLHPGDILDGYVIERVVATSGMATVFRAHDPNGRPVAIKLPHPEIESDPVLYDRFRREEEIGVRVEHPGVMKVYPSAGRSRVYMVMEWLDGRLLRSVLNEQKKFTPERTAELMIEIADAVEYIHGLGVVHRDLKPENIMVDDAGHIHLIDFGIAGAMGARRLTFAHFSHSMGTPDYISPEQVRGKRGDARSDIYAMGVMLYEMLTGQVPFNGANPFAVMNDRLLNQPRPPAELEPAVTPAMQEIIYRALEREPKNRYAHARELAYDLAHPEQVGVAARPEAAAWEKRRSPEARRVLVYLGLALIPVVLFLLLLAVARHR